MTDKPRRSPEPHAAEFAVAQQCEHNEYSSRGCERGTKGCDVKHPGPASPARETQEMVAMTPDEADHIFAAAAMAEAQAETPAWRAIFLALARKYDHLDRTFARRVTAHGENRQ